MNNEDKDIIIQFINCELTDISRESCAEWIAQDTERLNLYKKMQYADAIIDSRSDISDSRIAELLEEVKLRGARRVCIVPLMRRIAQYAAIIAVIITATFYFSGDELVLSGKYGIDEMYANYISTSAGQTREVELPDGTVVKLNANSSLAYAENFGRGKRRDVILDGEAFFDVAKDAKHPFVVNVRGMQVKVLGTVFNINGYNNDKIKTTLLSGKVEVNNNNGELISTLQPGTELVYNNNSKALISLNSVDATESTSWSKGYIKCRNMTLLELKPILENAYNAEVQFASAKASNVEVSGRVYLNIPIKDLASSLESVFDLKINISEIDSDSEKLFMIIE